MGSALPADTEALDTPISVYRGWFVAIRPKRVSRGAGNAGSREPCSRPVEKRPQNEHVKRALKKPRSLPSIRNRYKVDPSDGCASFLALYCFVDGLCLTLLLMKPALFLVCLLAIAGEFALSSAQPGASRNDALASSSQLIVVTTPGWESVEGRLQRFE